MMKIFVYRRHFSHSMRERRLVAYVSNQQPENTGDAGNRDELEFYFIKIINEGNGNDLKNAIESKLESDGLLDTDEITEFNDQCATMMVDLEKVQDLDPVVWRKIQDEFPQTEADLLKFVTDPNHRILTKKEVEEAKYRGRSGHRKGTSYFDSATGLMHYADGTTKTMEQIRQGITAKQNADQGIDANTRFNSITGKPITAEDRKWAQAMRSQRGDMGRWNAKIQADAKRYGIDRNAPRYTAARLPTYQVINGSNAPILKYEARQRTAKYMKDLDAKQNAAIAKRDAALKKHMPDRMSPDKVAWKTGREIKEGGKVIGRYVYFKGDDGEYRGVIMAQNKDGIETMRSNVMPYTKLVETMRSAVSDVNKLEKFGFTELEIQTLKECFGGTKKVSPDAFMKPSILALCEKYAFANKVADVLGTVGLSQERKEVKIAEITKKATFCSKPVKTQVLTHMFTAKDLETDNIAIFVQEPDPKKNKLFS